MWNLSTERNNPNSVKLESTPLGYVLALPFLLPNAEAEQWQMTARREILQAIADEGERQLADHANVIEAQQAANAVADRKATAEACRQRIAELQEQAEAAALGGHEINIDAAVKKISAEQLKLSAIENIIPTLEKTAATAAEEATAAVRSSDPTTPIVKRLQAERTEAIERISKALGADVAELARIEYQLYAALMNNASTRNELHRKYVPTAVKSHSERKLENV